MIFARTAAVLPKDVLDAEATAKARGSLNSAAEAMGFLPSALTGKIPLPVSLGTLWHPGILLSLTAGSRVCLLSYCSELCVQLIATLQC